MSKGFRFTNDKDFKNRQDILDNGLKLPYKKSDVENTCEEDKTFFADKEHLDRLKETLAERKK